MNKTCTIDKFFLWIAMTLIQLKIFVTIAEVGSVTRAAEIVGITQSAASAALAVLENSCEVKLFNRVGRSIELSEIGKSFLPEAQSIVLAAQNAARNLRALGGRTTGKVVIAASQTIANYWLPSRLAKFRGQFPDVLLNVKISNTRGVASALIEKQADIGFVEGPISSDQLSLTIIDHDQPGLVVSSRHWSSIRKLGSSVELISLPWVVREPGSGTRGVLEELAAEQGLQWDELNVILELPSNEAVREAVEAGAGVTLISQHVVASSLKSGSLRAIPMDVPPRDYQMVLGKERPADNATNALVGMITGGICDSQFSLTGS